MRPLRGFFALAYGLALVGCGPPPPPGVELLPPVPEFVAAPETALRAVSPLVLRELLDDGDWPSLRQALEHSRSWLGRQPAGRILTFGPRQVSVEELDSALAMVDGWLAEGPTPREMALRLGEAFDPMVTVGGQGSRMLITGYYEPLIAGSLHRTEEYDVPIYGLPSDLFRIELGDFRDEWRGRGVTGLLLGHRLLPYPDRREIRQGGRLRGREIAWARDRVELFFVEIQGSGALVLPDGRELRIGYAGANGRQYRSIGKLLIEEEKITRDEMSMQALRRYLKENPAEVERILDFNESQVFFRRLEGPPEGSLGVPVTPGRSIAVDHSLLPSGALGFLLTEVPGIDENGETIVAGSLRRFVLNQDAGGAIRGADRADFFWGRGEDAALRAGLMKQPGKLFILVPKPAGVASSPLR